MRRHLVLSLTLLLISIGLYTAANTVQPYQVDAKTTKKVAAFFVEPVPLGISSPEHLLRWLDEKKGQPDPKPPVIDELSADGWSAERAEYAIEMKKRQRLAESGVSEADLRVWITKSIDAKQKNEIVRICINTSITLIAISSIYIISILIKLSTSLPHRTRFIISFYIFYYTSVAFFYMTGFFYIVDYENIKPLLAVPLFFTALAYPLYKWVTHSKGR